VASAIIWGLAVSTLMSLFIVPLLYSVLVRPQGVTLAMALPPALDPETRPLRRLRDLLRPPLPITIRERSDLEIIRHNTVLQGLYRDARAELVNGQAWEALKLFEQADFQHPGNTAILLGMISALLTLMANGGYDEGFGERTEKLLAQLHRMDPDNRAYAAFSQALTELRQRPEPPVPAAG
ncbi:MAG: hypothetical protein RBS88_12770, partial [Spongiibacteraceae bacterium]|nr:hypothetical protein [Spongiibacteraceae bacterium]